MRYLRSNCGLLALLLSFSAGVQAKSFHLALLNDTNQTTGGGAGFNIKASEGKTGKYCTSTYAGNSEPIWENPLGPGIQSNSTVTLLPVSYGSNRDLKCEISADSIPNVSISLNLTYTLPGKDAPGCRKGTYCLCVTTTACQQMEATLSHFRGQPYELEIGYALPTQNCHLSPTCLPVQ